MDRNNDSFEQQFRQKMALDSEIVLSQKKEQSKRKWVFGGVLGLAAILLVTMIVFFIVYLNRPIAQISERTELMDLYEQLGDRMTYGELTEMVNELSPNASVMFDDGQYIIAINDESSNEYIACNIDSGDVEDVDYDTSPDNSLEVDGNEDNTEEVEIDLGELVNAAILEDGLTGDEDEASTEPVVNPYESNWEPAAATVMTYFTYYYFDEIEVADDETELKELYIRQNPNGDGYELFDGWNTIAVSTKTLAVDELSRIVSQ